MRRLVALPLTKSFQMAYQSIRVRFFRSLVTTMSLVLAVAFLTFTRAENNISQGMLTSQQPSFLQVLTKLGYDVEPGTTSIASTAKQRWIVFLSSGLRCRNN